MEKDKDNFFNKYADEYRQVIDNQEFIKQSSLNATISSMLIGDVLDIGNGGIVDYDPGQSNSLFSIDKSFKMLERDNSILSGRSICGDLKELPIKRGSFDIVLCKFLFHHLVHYNFKETEKYQRECLKQISQVLRPKGKVIIVENCVFRLVEWIELLGFSLWQKIFTCLKLPRLRFFSSKQLSFFLQSSGFKDLDSQKINLEKGWELIPFITSFPWLKIPSKFYPFEIILIEAKK